MDDTHGKIAAGLHIAMAVFSLAIVALIAVVFGGLAMLFDAGQSPGASALSSLFAAFGTAIAGFLALMSVLEIVAAVMYLHGSPGARIVLIVFSLLALLNVPVGTAIGAYSLWALLRPEAVPRPRALPATGSPA